MTPAYGSGAARHARWRPPEAVLFDYSGTLFDDTSVLTPGRLAAQCALRGRELPHRQAAALCTDIQAAVDSAEGRALRADADLSREGHRAVWTRLARTAPGSDALVAEAFYACVTASDAWRPYPDTEPVLTALHRAGVPVAVVSNTGWDIRGSFAAAGLTGLVTAFVLSCDLGVQKPDPAIFHEACDRLGVAPGRSLMVGDDPAKDGAATAAGLTARILPAARSVDRPRGLAEALGP
ncbi:HAD family hydrolase [Streptomyces sp. LHD-70]|uniref:HAD family hydrolase n=1 Tax=Streptomyces sp. LHD-70 TaxID=3072140 RepID=UPI00280FFC0D|nr:HAD family hydrolase [Streptomyces sp. LHD-70]MDQ8706938.1 HAD family hydrolase [Streptomyces sp. LHD-70]